MKIRSIEQPMENNIRLDPIPILKEIAIRDYCHEMPGCWFSYRHIDFPLTASRKESRYNTPYQDAFYLADSIETAKYEIQLNFDNKELHQATCPIYAFDSHTFCTKFSLTEALTGDKNSGSYEFCQKMAGYLTATAGLSAIYYPSRQMALQGMFGGCVVLLPAPHQLVSNELRIFKRSP